MSKPADESRQWGERTLADLSSLLVELSRALKGLGFYAEGHPSRADLLDRAFFAWKIELERAGPLELWTSESGFRASGIGEQVSHGPMQELARALLEHDVQRVAFSPQLARESFHAFVELLRRSEQGIARCGGFARALADRASKGIVIDGGEEAALSAQQSLASTPAVATASLGSALLARSHRLVVAAGPGEKPRVEEHPLDAPAGDERGERLLFRLIELDRCADDAAYEFLARRIVEWGSELFRDGLRDECYRAILVLADHAVGDGGRSGLQARVAQAQCVRLASETRLADLIDRACSNEVAASVRATQVLLQLGDHAVSAVFDRLCSEKVSSRSAQLTAILITLGETALPFLLEVIGAPQPSAAPERALIAVRIAGEIQNPQVVPTLVKLLHAEPAALRREAARALVHVGTEASLDALIDALTGPLEDMHEVAATCLGALHNPRALQPMLDGLERALLEGRMQSARDLIRALGQLGCERAVPRLVALVERRSFLRRRQLREIKLCALAALERLPGREARKALLRATRNGDSAVRRRAEQLLSAGAGSAGSSDGSLH